MLVHNTSSLPLLALPTGEDVCNSNAVLKIDTAFFETVLDCNEDKDPLGLLAKLNRKSGILIQFTQADFQPGCTDNQIVLILHEKGKVFGGEWPPLHIDVMSGPDEFTLTLQATSRWSKGAFLNGFSFKIPYKWVTGGK